MACISKKNKLSQFLFLTGLMCLSTQASAWSNYFRFVNNFPMPITVSIQPGFSSVNNLSGGAITGVNVDPRSISPEFEFETDQEHWYSLPSNNGTITIAEKNDPASFCQYNYDYEYDIIHYSYFDLHSERISLAGCHGNLSSKEISVVNTHNEALPRPLVGTVGHDVTQSLSVADCGGAGGDNCLIVSPDLNTFYKSNGSTLAQALKLQSQLDQYEPLNFEQFIGSHNSAISQHYTNSQSNSNLSHADPDNFLTLTDQLNSGVRMLELDIMWTQNQVMLCHTDPSLDPSANLCEDNFPLSTAISEIQTWVASNPDAFLFIYLDVHAPLTGHVSDLDAVLSPLAPYVFTPKMASDHFQVQNNTLPAYQLTQDNLLNQFKKNIVITNDDDQNNLLQSQYVFVNVQNSKASPLTEAGVDTYYASGHASCADASKYNNMKAVFGDDPDHYNLLRLNAGRTVLNYVTSVKDKDPDEYSNYLTTQDLPALLACPFNIFATSLLGFTCDTDDCNAHPTDPRLFGLLWSWELGYPLQKGGSEIVYINPQTLHFENEPLSVKTSYAVLCNRATTQASPVAPLQWFLTSINLTGADNAYQQAQQACQAQQGQFVVPTVSYWMQDASSLIQSQQQYVLVNYQHQMDQWIPNIRSTERKSVSLVRKT